MSLEETKIGGGSTDRFPLTRWSAIAATYGENPDERRAAFDYLTSIYWKPVYKYIRIKWRKSNEDAKDLTQGFFTKAIEKSFFKGYDSRKARFRTFLRTCLDGFVANEEKAAGRVKRGGDTPTLSFDFEAADGELRQIDPPDPSSANDLFDHEWIRSLFGAAIEGLQLQCTLQKKSIHFQIFERYDLHEDRATYSDVAAEFDLSVTTLTNHLAFARREFRRILLEKLREITVTDEEFQQEARSLLGISVK